MKRGNPKKIAILPEIVAQLLANLNVVLLLGFGSELGVVVYACFFQPVHVRLQARMCAVLHFPLLIGDKRSINRARSSANIFQATYMKNSDALKKELQPSPQQEAVLVCSWVSKARFLGAMATDPGLLYYCYHCEQTVQLASPDTLICADCHSDFIEERPNGGSAIEDSPSASEFTFNEIDYMGPGFGQLLEDMSSFLSHMQVTPTAAHGSDASNEETPQVLRLGTDARALNPILFLQGRIQNLLNLRDGDHVVDNGPPLRLPGTIGDYFVGPGIEHLIQQLAENDSNKYGTPPASKSAVTALPTVTISKDHLGTDAAQCAVCKEEFELLLQVKQLPCSHMYHPDCILPWLEQHNSCPVCRHELPTDDPDYEQLRARRVGAGEFSGARGDDGLLEDQRVQDALAFQSFPGQPVVASYSAETANDSEQQGIFLSAQSNGTQGSRNNGYDGNALTERHFAILSPWLRSVPRMSQPHVYSRGESLSEGSNLLTLSSGASSDRNAQREQIIRGLLISADSDGDAVMSETREEELD
ncbi:hypothetical protein L7F22_029696 [Adiantum nelumboides]|nr:hypothetical protein [Adiantum nelumboides]